MASTAKPQIRVGHFEADGNAVNLDLGFVPNYVKIANFTAAEDAIWMQETWLKEMGDAVCVSHKIIKNDGGSNVTTPVMLSTGGYIAAYDTNAFTETDSVVSASGFQGITISADFMTNSDEIFYYAEGTDRDVDHGDINA